MNFNEEEERKTDLEDENFSLLKLKTFFVTSENGIKAQDSYNMEKDLEGIFGIFHLLDIRNQYSVDYFHKT